MKWLTASLFTAAVAAAACAPASESVSTYMGAPVCSYAVENEYPHATDAFTQGLVFHEDRLIESTGLEGQSSLREVELETGQVVRRVDLPDDLFAEGIAIVGDLVRQLTWTSGVGFDYNLATLRQVGQFEYEGEGWGLTYDGSALVMSDGSARLAFRHAQSFEVIRTLEVTAGGEPVTRLNELEYIDGEIWANVWQTDLIARIDPESGRVASWLDLAGLLADEMREPSTGILNGIAHDAGDDRVFVTGKYWPLLFEISAANCGS